MAFGKRRGCSTMGVDAGWQPLSDPAFSQTPAEGRAMRKIIYWAGTLAALGVLGALSLERTFRMRALFDYGYNLARHGSRWKKILPGLEIPLGL